MSRFARPLGRPTLFVVALAYFSLLAVLLVLWHMSPGLVLIREGDPGTAVYLLLAGSVKVTGATDEGGSLLAIRVGGDLVGELAVLDGRPRVATVTTPGPVLSRRTLTGSSA